MNTPTRIAAFLALGFSILTPAHLFAQGSLTPPAGPPAATMKTLQQIEPRIDLQNAPAAVVTTTNAAYHYIITQPGSYYLSANLGVTKTNGIQINADGVTLDLNGFEISRASGSGGNGIQIAGNRASVRNGSLQGFAYGIRSGVLPSGFFVRAGAFRDLSVGHCTEIGISAGTGAVLESCRAHDNSGFAGISAEEDASLSNCVAIYNTATYGIRVTSGASLTDCTAAYNTGSHGISTSSGSSLINCTAKNNTATYGIVGGIGSSLTNCTAYSNSGAGTTSAGIQTGAGATISHCTSYLNFSSAAASTPTTGMGFDVGIHNTVHGCTANQNEGDGINLSSDTSARDNTCVGNGRLTGDGAGIHATGSDNRIEGNNVTDNDRGIDVDNSGNIIIQNTASGNTTNWDVSAGNKCLVVLGVDTAAAIVGDSGGTSPGSTNPNANYTY